jgi:menaquinone-dependent protoporphyrinogen IX oxidase
MALLFMVFLVWYQWRYSMKTVTSYEVNTPSEDRKLLIATQGSTFKNTVAQGLVDHYKQDSIYMKIIDVADLSKIHPEDFSALVILHTWENWEPPASVKSFVQENEAQTNKMVIFTTSGEGNYKMEKVDALTGESIIEEAPVVVDKIITKLKPLLNTAH